MRLISVTATVTDTLVCPAPVFGSTLPSGPSEVSAGPCYSILSPVTPTLLWVSGGLCRRGGIERRVPASILALCLGLAWPAVFA